MLCCSSTIGQVDAVYDSVLLHYSPEDIAREITLIDRGMLIRLNYTSMITSINNSTAKQVIIPLSSIVVSDLHIVGFSAQRCCRHMLRFLVLLHLSISFSWVCLDLFTPVQYLVNDYLHKAFQCSGLKTPNIYLTTTIVIR